VSETDEAWLEDAIERFIADRDNKTLHSYYANRPCPRCGIQRVKVSYDPAHPERIEVVCTLCGAAFVWQREPGAEQ
jgi:endogenous inhibitor of DNA gyrase (YacG/DUF329 family)